MTNREKRIRRLEALLTDPSGLVPHSQRWLEYWDRQMYLHATHQPRDSSAFSVEAIRAVMKYADDPASMLGSVSRTSEYADSRDCPY